MENTKLYYALSMENTKKFCTLSMENTKNVILYLWKTETKGQKGKSEKEVWG